MKTSGIGGQAVMEGVMMKNGKDYAIAVRKPDGQIEIKKDVYESIITKHGILRLPIIRGMVVFVESMVVGMKALTYSSEFYEEEEETGESKVDVWFQKVFKDKTDAVLMGFTIVMAILMAAVLFIFVPFVAANLFSLYIESSVLLSLCEGLFRLAVFLAYVLLISQMKDIKRVFMYHGAEHKSINCIEHGYELTVENVRRQSKEHKRCGTSFLVYVMLISIVFFTVIRVNDRLLQLILRIILIPVIAGVSYEFIRFAGKSSSKIMNVLSKPGMWVQGMTTREPDDHMIEVAIQSVEAVFDWKAFLEKEFPGGEEKQEPEEMLEAAALEQKKETALEDDEDDDEYYEDVDDFDIEEWDGEEDISERGHEEAKYNVIDEKKDFCGYSEAKPDDIEEDEDDEVLKALDEYFENEEER